MVITHSTVARPSVRAKSFGGPRRSADRRARPPVEPAHLPLEAIDAARARHPAHPVLVKQISEQVLLVVRQAVQQREQVRLVAQHDLRRDDRGGGGLAHDERRRVRQRRDERVLQAREFVFEDLRGQAQGELGERDEAKGVRARLGFLRIRRRDWGGAERYQGGVEGRKAVDRLDARGEGITEAIRRLKNL